MRYGKGGIEVQYRECQIMREAAKVFKSQESGYLLRNEKQWLEEMASAQMEHPIKNALIPPMIGFITQMDDDRKAAVAEYVEYLVKKERGIEVMVPFTATNRYTVLPVNVHKTVDDKRERDG